jgi:hypothetical protein
MGGVFPTYRHLVSDSPSRRHSGSAKTVSSGKVAREPTGFHLRLHEPDPLLMAPQTGKGCGPVHCESVIGWPAKNPRRSHWKRAGCYPAQ